MNEIKDLSSTALGLDSVPYPWEKIAKETYTVYTVNPLTPNDL
jgi:hypothetical protein